MKKILTVTVAASMALCATAADDPTFISGTSFSGTSFEDLSEGSNLIKGANDAGDDNNVCYWSTDAWTENAADYEGFFVVTNISEDASYPANNRPEQWATASNSKALAIDTDKPLNRFINVRGGDGGLTPESVSDKSVFFDSVVQFTATDASPSIAEGKDRLLVWLYSSPEDVATTPGLFGEATPMTSLVVTARCYEEIGGVSHELITNYCVSAEGVSVNPDEWHRLTIKAFVSDDDKEQALFNVFVDGKKVSAEGGKSDFISLKDGDSNIVGVAFDGKGMVDDIAFTTTAPSFAQEEEKETYSLTFTFDAANFTSYSLEVDSVSVSGFSSANPYIINVGSTVRWVVMPATGLDLYVDGEKVTLDAFGRYANVFTVTAAGSRTIVLTTVLASDSDDKPTIGGVGYDGNSLVEVAKSGAQITVPSDGWSVEGNVLKDAKNNAFATFAAYYVLTKDGTTVTVALDQKAAAPFAEATDLDDGEEVFELGEEEGGDAFVGVRVKAFPGLWYGLGTAAELGTWSEPAEWTAGDTADDNGVIQLKAIRVRDAKAGFFKVRVEDVNPQPQDSGN